MNDIIQKFVENLPAILTALAGVLVAWRSLSTKIGEVSGQVGEVKHTLNSELTKFKEEAAIAAKAVLEKAVSEATLKAEKVAEAKIAELEKQLAETMSNAAAENARRIDRLEAQIHPALASGATAAPVPVAVVNTDEIAAAVKQTEQGEA